MKRFIPFFLFICLASGVFAQVGTLTVTNVDSEAGTGITVVDYEFTGDAGTYDISAEVSFDNGATYSSIPDEHITTGNLTDVIPGTHQLIWDGSASFPETFSDKTIVRITAEFTWQCGDNITFTYRDGQVTYGTVSETYISVPVKDVLTLCWLDRNLGAEPMPFVPADDATGNTDTKLYGDLFQWGRLDDGHQVRDPLSGTTGTQSSNPDPGHGDFIINHPNWYNGTNPDDLWQEDGNGININNPCPAGWRVPTKVELDAEREDWDSDDSAGAFLSRLKWPVGGLRNSGGALDDEGIIGYVWSSSVSDANVRSLSFGSGDASENPSSRAFGMSVRCVRDN